MLACILTLPCGDSFPFVKPSSLHADLRVQPLLQLLRNCLDLAFERSHRKGQLDWMLYPAAPVSTASQDAGTSSDQQFEMNKCNDERSKVLLSTAYTKELTSSGLAQNQNTWMLKKKKKNTHTKKNTIPIFTKPKRHVQWVHMKVRNNNNKNNKKLCTWVYDLVLFNSII